MILSLTLSWCLHYGSPVFVQTYTPFPQICARIHGMAAEYQTNTAQMNRSYVNIGAQMFVCVLLTGGGGAVFDSSVTVHRLLSVISPNDF